MNTEAIKQEIQSIIDSANYKRFRQAPVAKHQEATLKELGIYELIERDRNFGYTDAKRIIEAATDSGKMVGGWTGGGDADYAKTPASKLFQLLNAVEAEIEPIMVTELPQTVVLVPNEDFSIIHVVCIINRDVQTKAFKVKNAGQLAYALTQCEIGKDANVFVSDNPRTYYHIDSTAWFGFDEWNTIQKKYQLRQL